MGKRRAFGSVRRLKSGRWQATYTHPETGVKTPAGRSFETKADAAQYLAEIQTDFKRGEAIDQSAGTQRLGEYASQWLASRTDLRPKTLELYEYLLRLYIVPVIGDKPIGKIDARTIRTWYGVVNEGDQSSVTSSKAYRLLKQILSAAVEDRVLRANPCSLKGAAAEHSAERPIPSLADVMGLAEAIQPEYRLMVLLAGIVGLRRGECFALRVADVVFRGDRATIVVDSSIVFVNSRPRRELPKTTAGVRRLALPPSITAEVRDHIERFDRRSADDLLIVDLRTNDTPTLTVWRRAWAKAKDAADVDCTFHDLRHHAGTLTASAGASIRESMARLGHSSPRAALRYQHAVEERDAEVASAIERLLA